MKRTITDIKLAEIILNYSQTIALDDLSAQDLFEENFKRIGKRWLYLDNGNLSIGFNEYYKVKKDQRKRLYDAIQEVTDNWYCKEQLLDYTDQELFNLLEKEVNGNIQSIEETCEEFDIEITNDYETINIVGYSQGDYATVIVNVVELEKLTGSVFNKKTYKEIFERYFYDFPIVCSICFDGDPYFNKDIEGKYEGYDTNEVINYFYNELLECYNFTSSQKKLVKKLLENNIPDEIS